MGRWLRIGGGGGVYGVGEQNVTPHEQIYDGHLRRVVAKESEPSLRRGGGSPNHVLRRFTTSRRSYWQWGNPKNPPKVSLRLSQFCQHSFNFCEQRGGSQWKSNLLLSPNAFAASAVRFRSLHASPMPKLIRA